MYGLPASSKSASSGARPLASRARTTRRYSWFRLKPSLVLFSISACMRAGISATGSHRDTRPTIARSESFTHSGYSARILYARYSLRASPINCESPVARAAFSASIMPDVLGRYTSPADHASPHSDRPYSSRSPYLMANSPLSESSISRHSGTLSRYRSCFVLTAIRQALQFVSCRLALCL